MSNKTDMIDYINSQGVLLLADKIQYKVSTDGTTYEMKSATSTTTVKVDDTGFDVKETSGGVDTWTEKLTKLDKIKKWVSDKKL